MEEVLDKNNNVVYEKMRELTAEEKALWGLEVCPLNHLGKPDLNWGLGGNQNGRKNNWEPQTKTGRTKGRWEDSEEYRTLLETE